MLEFLLFITLLPSAFSAAYTLSELIWFAVYKLNGATFTFTEYFKEGF